MEGGLIPLPLLYLSIIVTLAVAWVVGEAADKPLLRRTSGPLFAVLLATVVGGTAVLDTAFDDSIRYSGATKRFVAALVAAIERGEIEEAHDELRHFDATSYETYEGGAFLRWLGESVDRLDRAREKAVRDPSAGGE